MKEIIKKIAEAMKKHDIENMDNYLDSASWYFDMYEENMKYTGGVIE